MRYTKREETRQEEIEDQKGVIRRQRHNDLIQKIECINSN